MTATLPIEIIKKLKFREKQRVVVKSRGKTIAIKDFK